ncbi:unnamed protein product, partial [Cylicostephanus goldi]
MNKMLTLILPRETLRKVIVFQPNFDESLDYEDNYESSSAAEECAQIEPEEFTPYISPSPSAETLETAAIVEEPNNPLEKSLEVQDEDEGDQDMEENGNSVVIVETEEEAMEEENAPEEPMVPEKERQKQSQEALANPIVELAEDQIDEQSVEQQDEDEGIEDYDGEDVSVPKIVSVVEEQQEEEEAADTRGPVVLISEQRDEGEELEPVTSERLSFIEQEEQDEEEEYPEST